MIRRLIFLVAIVLTCMSAAAAPNDVKCTGVLLGTDGEPIIGATVSVPGTSQATASDIDGRFILSVPKGKDIHVSYIGYQPLTLKASPDMGEIKMEVESQMLQRNLAC